MREAYGSQLPDHDAAHLMQCLHTSVGEGVEGGGGRTGASYPIMTLRKCCRACIKVWGGGNRHAYGWGKRGRPAGGDAKSPKRLSRQAAKDDVRIYRIRQIYNTHKIHQIYRSVRPAGFPPASSSPGC